MSYVSDARIVWKLLNGFITVHKPFGATTRSTSDLIKQKICEGLNSMKTRDVESIVEIRRICSNEKSKASSQSDKSSFLPVEHDQSHQHLNQEYLSQQCIHPSQEKYSSLETSTDSTKYGRLETVVKEFMDGPDTIQIVKTQNLADHPLVIGPRYQPDDVKIQITNPIGIRTSGILLIGLNNSTKNARKVRDLKWMSTYIATGKFGVATNTGFHEDRIVDKATWHKISLRNIERYLASQQAAYQRVFFSAAGVRLNTEKAYELAAQGLPRPSETFVPLILSLKLLKFEPPNFEIEITTVNQTENFLFGFVHDLGIRLHSAATCTKLRCIKFGPFTDEQSLLSKHISPETIINQIQENSKILKDVNFYQKDPLLSECSIDRKQPESPSKHIMEVEKIKS